MARVAALAQRLSAAGALLVLAGCGQSSTATTTSPLPVVSLNAGCSVTAASPSLHGAPAPQDGVARTSGSIFSKACSVAALASFYDSYFTSNGWRRHPDDDNSDESLNLIAHGFCRGSAAFMVVVSPADSSLGRGGNSLLRVTDLAPRPGC